MIEKLAKAAYARFYGLDWSEAEWEERGYEDSYQEYLANVAENDDLARFPNVWRGAEFIDCTRAVLKAMREPTPEMVSAGRVESADCGDQGREVMLTPSEMSRVWQAMIDAILAEDKVL